MAKNRCPQCSELTLTLEEVYEIKCPKCDNVYQSE